MASNKQICEAIRKNRGGHANTSDAGLMMIWRSLDEGTQKKYLDSIKKKGEPNASDS